jgi:hypothetical protein
MMGRLSRHGSGILGRDTRAGAHLADGGERGRDAAHVGRGGGAGRKVWSRVRVGSKKKVRERIRNGKSVRVLYRYRTLTGALEGVWAALPAALHLV